MIQSKMHFLPRYISVLLTTIEIVLVIVFMSLNPFNNRGGMVKMRQKSHITKMQLNKLKHIENGNTNMKSVCD